MRRVLVRKDRSRWSSTRSAASPFRRRRRAIAALTIVGTLLTPGATLPAFGSPGDLDTTFGGDGKVTTVFGRHGRAYGVAIQPDGKIVACGAARKGRLVIARYDTDGALDPTFGADGKVSGLAGTGACRALAIQPDGKIVAGGGVLARYDTDGSLDTSFGEIGIVATDGVSALAIQADGQIVTASSSRETVSRYDTDGSLDTSFGDDGTVSTNVFTTGGWANALAIQDDGKIVAAGGGGECYGGWPSECDWFSALFRLNADGTWDETFATDGVTGATGEETYAVAIQDDGKIVAAGVSYGRDRFALTRIDTDGTRDETFGADGAVNTRFTRPSIARALAIQADGGIVAAGTAYGDHGSRFALARYAVA